MGIFAPTFLSNEEAAGFWRRAAEQGLPCAALSLAWATERGTYGFAPNRARAALWYARAAEGGSEEAAAQLRRLFAGVSRLEMRFV